MIVLVFLIDAHFKLISANISRITNEVRIYLIDLFVMTPLLKRIFQALVLMLITSLPSLK